MASPFKLFRKHQKTAFVALTIMAMISFIILPNILQSLGGRGSREVTFATYRLGNTFRSSKIDAMMLHNITNETSNLAKFYERLAGEIMAESSDPSYYLRRMASTLLNLSEEQSVEQWLVAQYMRNEGYTVSREEVGEYLRRLTPNPTTQQSFMTEKIFRSAAEATGFRDRYITLIVGNQMLVEQFYSMSDMSVLSLTPETEFDWYNRFNRRMRVEAIPVSVADFTSLVAAPTKKELNQFFEEKKFIDRNPHAPESGFGIPMMVRAEYVSYDKTMLRPDEIPDEEVELYYEENKESFVERPMPTMRGMSPGMSGIPNPGAFGRFGSMDSGWRDLDSTDDIDDDIVAPSEGDTTSVISIPVGELSQQSKESSDITPQSEESAEAAPQSEAAPGADDVAPTQETPAQDIILPETPTETSGNTRSLPIRLVSYQTEGEGETTNAEAAPPADDSAAPADTDTPSVVDAETTSADVDVSPVDTPSVDADAPSAPMPILTLPPGGGLSGPPLGLPLGGARPGIGSGWGGTTTSPFGNTMIPNLGTGPTNPALAATPVAYRPLDDALKAEIRDILAKERMDAKLNQVQDVMSDYHREYIKSIQQKNANLALPDLSALAKKHGLNYVNLGHIDSFDLMDKDYDFANSSVMSNENPVPVGRAIFAERGIVNEKRGYRSQRVDTHYLFWVTEITEARIPKFDDPGMPEKVEARWRQVEARALAQEKAGALAQAAQQAEGSLLEYFTAHPNKDVKNIVGTEFFSWLGFNDYSNSPYFRFMRPEIFRNEVRETGVMFGESERDNIVLKDIGNDFMQAVYNLELGGITVTHNVPKDTYFVVRLVEVAPSEDTTFETFSLERPEYRSIYTQAAVENRLSQVRQGALKKVFERTKFQWKVKPSEYQQQERLKSRENPNDRVPPGGRNVPSNMPQF